MVDVGNGRYTSRPFEGRNLSCTLSLYETCAVKCVSYDSCCGADHLLEVVKIAHYVGEGETLVQFHHFDYDVAELNIL